MPSDGRVTRGLGLLIAGLLCAPAHAGADWLAAAYLGHAATQPSTISLALPDRQTRLEIVDAEYRGESFVSPQYYGLRVGWIPEGRWLGVEAEFIHAKVYTQTGRVARIRGTLDGAPIDASLPLSSVVQRLAMSHGLNFLLANLVVRREFGRVAIAGRAGAGPTLPHAESTIGDAARDRLEGGGAGAQVGAGVDLALWRGLGLLGEYKFTWVDARINVAGGNATIPARSHHIVFGTSWRF